MKKFTLLSLLFAVSFIIAEVLLQIAFYSSKDVRYQLSAPWVRDQFTRPDPVLGHRGNPLKYDHDASGFRNRVVPTNSDVVVLGDSHAYGTAVEREQAWPELLEQQSGQSIYNMGFGGYGQLHQLILLPQAMELEPETIILAIYMGNDLADNFTLFSKSSKFSHWLATNRREHLLALEKQRRLADEISPLYPFYQPDTDKPETAQSWISEHIRLYGLLRSIKYSLQQKQFSTASPDNFADTKAAISEDKVHLVRFFQEPPWETVLTTAYRYPTCDPSRPRIEAGFKLGLRAIKEIKQQLDSANITFRVILLPTKESVAAAISPSPEKYSGLAQLSSNEASYRQRFIQALEAMDIKTLDLLPDLAGAKEQTYFRNMDGHPNPEGHRVIADRLQEWLEMTP